MKGSRRVIAVLAALILLVSIFPAQSSRAEETSAPKLNVSERTVYVGGSTVRTKNYGNGTYTLKLKDKPKKYSCVWENEDADVISLTEEKGGKATITALKVGNSKVTATVTDKTTKKVYTLTAKITVKKNCAALQITGIPKEPIEVGETAQLSATMYDAAGREAAAGSMTDTIKWKSSSKKIATVDENGVVTALKAGTVDITCYSVDAATGKYSKFATASAQKTVTIEVKDPDIIGIVNISQKSLNSIELTFGKDYSKVLTPEKLSIVGGDSIIFPVEELEFSEDGLTAKATVKGVFADSMTYVVALSGTDATVGLNGSFAAMKGAPTRMELDTPLGDKKVVAGEHTELGFKIFNAQGVDITPLDKGSNEYLSYKLITTYKDPNAGKWSGFVNDGYIYAQVENTKAVVETTMSGSIVIDGAVTQINLTSSDIVTAVSEAATIKFDTEKDLILTDSLGTGESLNFAGDALIMPAKETSGYKLVARVKDYTGKYIYSDGTAAGKVTFESPSKVVCTYVKSNGEVISLDNAGSDLVYVKFNGKIIGTATITVTEARKATTMVLMVDGTPTSYAFGSNKAGVGGTRIDVMVYDQYGQILPIKSKVSGSIATNLEASMLVTSKSPLLFAYANEDGTGYVEGDSAGFDASNYLYRITYKDEVYGSVSSDLTLIVKAPVAADLSTYKLALEGSTDMTLSSVMNEFPCVKVILYEMKGGVKYGTLPVYASESAAPVDGFFYKLNKAGMNDAISITGCTENDKIYTVYSDYTGKLSRLDPGDYVISIYQKKQGGVIAIVGTTFALTGAAGKYTVTNTSETTTQAITNETAKDTAMLRKIFTECFSVKKDGVEVSGMGIDFPTEPVVDGNGILYLTVAITENIKISNKVYTMVYNIDVYQKIVTKP